LEPFWNTWKVGMALMPHSCATVCRRQKTTDAA
jgi:hypothetical protein